MARDRRRHRGTVEVAVENRVTTVRGALRTQALILGGTLAVFWVVFVVNLALGGALLSLGVIPRTTVGLRGVLFAPFLHGSLDHIVANSIPFVVLGWMVMLRDERHFIPVTLAGMIGSALMAWLLGAPGSVHIGASGLVFGYLGFLMLSGWYARSFGSILLSVIVTLVWGSLVLGIMPGVPGISWQAHLGGFLGGVLAARSFRSSRAKNIQPIN
ncbi:MAG: rhomboid family intramembrane serine protease [Gemmatimonadaceae bacterium]